MDFEEVKILGVGISNINLIDLKNILLERGNPIYIVTPNPEMVYLASINDSFKDLLNKAKYKLPDGIGILIASKIYGRQIKERISGIDAFELLGELGKLRIFLLGAKEEVVKEAAKRLKDKFPNIEAIDCHNGYFNDSQNDMIVEKVKNFNANILFVGLGCPKQEEWIYKNFKKTNADITIGIGGSFDIISGYKKRAPLIVRKIGCEWIYRFLQEPRRRALRILRVPLYLIKVIIEGARIRLRVREH